MADFGSQPQQSVSELSDVPNATTSQSTSDGTTNLQNANEALVNSASSAFNAINNHPFTQSVKDHPVTQSVKDTVTNGPVAEGVKAQTAATSNEFTNLANARTRPSEAAATGQPLTHYHSFFYHLLSWENPRATGITFVATVVFIFLARYLNILRYILKFLAYTLGVTASAEIAGKAIFSSGFMSQVRPRKYYTIPRETLERSLEDVQELINFFVIEFQRIVFAENVPYTVAAFLISIVSYGLVRFLPLWGLALTATLFLYLGPLIYVSNREVIDEQIHNASEILNKQANQVKELAGQHTARATETVKSVAGDYTAKAQGYIGATKNRMASPTSSPTASKPYSSSDFPAAPKQDPTPIASQYSTSEAGVKQEPISL